MPFYSGTTARLHDAQMAQMAPRRRAFFCGARRRWRMLLARRETHFFKNINNKEHS
jgi:hypothetical protein